jgi:hypothetical protein
MNKHTKLRWFTYKVRSRLELLEGKEYAQEVDKLIEEIKTKKWDQHLQFQQLIESLLEAKKEALAPPERKTREYDPFEIPRSGVGRIALFGLSNVGKSTLMNAITNTEVNVGNYLHTTTVGQAGACTYQGVTYQIVDLPGFLDFKEDWALSRQIVRVARTSDAIMMVIDLTMDIDRQLAFLTKQLEEGKLLENNQSDYKIAIIATKGDLPGSKEAYDYLQTKTDWPIYPTAYNNEASLENLKKAMFKLLKVIRVYTKPPGKKPNLQEPFIINKGATVAEVVEKIHSSFTERFRYAKIWGESVEYEGQQVGLEHRLTDKDILEIILSK